jgi:predicted N-formylglutamate amidohydrolase
MKKKKKTVKKPPPKSKTPARLISAGEPKAFRIENAAGKTAGAIICDHASNRMPKVLKDLGVKKADLKKHIAWDIGAEEISRQLGRALDMPVILASYSRLIVDLNRAPYHHEGMLAESDHIAIPGNKNLSKQDKDRRLKQLFWPYQKEIGKVTDKFVRKKKTPLLIAVHSFTPAMEGKKRPWHISVLWRREEKIAKQIVQALRRSNPSLLIGENEPYTLFDERFAGSTIDRHAEQRGLPYIFVEFRQDLIDTKEKAAQWAEIFAAAVRAVLDNPENYLNRKIKPLKI